MTQQTTNTAVAKRDDDTKAVIMLGNEQIRVRLDKDGFITRTMRTVRLNYGTELYCAARNPSDDDKVAPFQPGYMKLVAAMGGQLQCPPVMRDPVTGDPRPNPIISTYGETGLIRSVTATAVCAVRNPITGEWVASIQTITIDTEHILRQALLKLERDDSVRILSGEDVEAERREGKLKGWSVIPLAPPYSYICANNSVKAVREALQTYANQSATIRQRACSKAERLAADHNPITRMNWHYGTLLWPRDKEGKVTGPAYMDVTVVAWVEHHGKKAIDEMVRSLAVEGRHDSVVDVVVGDSFDTSGSDGDADPDRDDEDAVLEPSERAYANPPRLTEVLPEAPAPAKAADPIPAKPVVETPPVAKAAPAPETAKPKNVAEAQAAADPATAKLIAQCKDFEGELGEGEVTAARLKAGLPADAPIPATTTVAVLRAYRTDLQARLDAQGS